MSTAFRVCCSTGARGFRNDRSDWRILIRDKKLATDARAIHCSVIPTKVFEASYAKMHQAIRTLVKRGVETGEIRSDLDPVDLLRALVGVSNVASTPDWQPTARRLVDILIGGSRPVKSPEALIP